MGIPPQTPVLGGLPMAFAQACRQARSDMDLLDRCREALIQQFDNKEIYFTLSTSGREVRQGPEATDGPGLVEVCRCTVGETELRITATAKLSQALRPVAAHLALGLTMVLELQSVLLERQASLDDAVFQLRALRQVARLLSSVHSTEETEHLVLDFMAEVFFAWWACLYRPAGNVFVPRSFRSLDRERAPAQVDRDRLEKVLPLGTGVADSGEVELSAMLPPGTELVVPLDAGGERLAILLLGARLNGHPYGRAERDLAGTLSFAAAIALKNAELVERLQSAASTDELTGLFNRRALEERLLAE